MEQISLVVPETEEITLAACLESPAVLRSVLESGLRPEDFLSDPHRYIFSAMRSMSERMAHVNEVTLKAQLEKTGKLEMIGGGPVIERLSHMDVSTAATMEYASIIKDRSLRRRMLDAAERIVEATHREESIADLLDVAERSIFQVSERIAAGISRGITGADLADLYRNRSDEFNGIPFPYFTMNRRQRGRNYGSLNIWMGYSSDGKTVVGLGNALDAAQRGFKTAIYSLEMDEGELLYRLLAMMTSATKSQIENNELTIEQGIEVEEALSELTDLPLTIYADPALTPADIRRIQMRSKDELLVVDYLQRFDYREYADIPRIAKQFKNIALSTGCCVDLLSQVTPPQHGLGQNPFPRPSLSNTFGGKATGHEANNVYCIWAKRENDGGGRWVRTGYGELICLKARGGGGEYVVPMKFKPNSVRWIEEVEIPV